MLIRYVKKLDVIVEKEDQMLYATNQKTDYLTRNLINEFSTVQVIRLLQQYF